MSLLQSVTLVVNSLLMCECGKVVHIILLDREHTHNKQKSDFLFTAYCSKCWQEAKSNNEDLKPK